MPVITKNEVLEKIMQGEIAEALELYRLLADESGQSRYQKDAILLSGRHAKHQKDFNAGILTTEEARIEQARLMHALTSYIEQLPDNLSVTTRGIVKPHERVSSPDPSPVEPTEPRSKPTNVGAKKILFLSANPEESGRLRIDQEVRDIEIGLKLAQQRDRFDLESKWAVRVRDLRRALLDESPQIVHFSGHGAGAEGLVLENDQGEPQMVAAGPLGNLFSLFAGQIECVVLNACYSENQAQEIVRHIPYVIGMNKAVPDKTAIEFSVAFYDALGNGRDYEFAYRYACNAIELEGQSGALIPVLKKQA